MNVIALAKVSYFPTQKTAERPLSRTLESESYEIVQELQVENRS
jgi:hypothetical protein